MKRLRRFRPSGRRSITSRNIPGSDSGPRSILDQADPTDMSRRRVVITGLGVVTSLGETVDGMWDQLCTGRSGIKTVTRFDLSQFPVRFGGECTNFDILSYAPQAARFTEEKIQPKRLDRFGQFGVAAS